MRFEYAQAAPITFVNDGTPGFEHGIRFIGDADTRIREDYLRILRLFRFHAWYGKGEIDADAMRAAAAEKAGIAKLSGERIAKEMLRLFEAENPAPVLRPMTASGILAEVLPGEANVARLESLAKIDAVGSFAPDALLRLAALLPHDARIAATVADRWKLSNAARERLAGRVRRWTWTGRSPRWRRAWSYYRGTITRSCAN